MKTIPSKIPVIHTMFIPYSCTAFRTIAPREKKEKEKK